MAKSAAEKRQIENEMIFRRANEKVGVVLDTLNAKNTSEGDVDLNWNKETLLHFMCECSDENCAERIPTKLSTYRKIHLNRDTFIIKPDHQSDAVEEVVRRKPHYWVVKKHVSLSDPGNRLNATNVDNT